MLHVLWAGVCRDVTGSLLMELAEFATGAGDSFDERLRYLHAQAVTWCSQNRIRPSTIEPFSPWHKLRRYTLILFVDHVINDVYGPVFWVSLHCPTCCDKMQSVISTPKKSQVVSVGLKKPRSDKAWC